MIVCSKSATREIMWTQPMPSDRSDQRERRRLLLYPQQRKKRGILTHLKCCQINVEPA